MDEKKNTKYYQRAARTVLNHYEEVLSVVDKRIFIEVSCFGRVEALPNMDGGGAEALAGAGYTKMKELGSTDLSNPNMITVTVSDFIADVEIQARKTLNELEYIYFRSKLPDNQPQVVKWIRDSMTPEDFRRFLDELLLKLGRVFDEVGIYPVQEYFEPVDRRKKLSEAQWRKQRKV